MTKPLGDALPTPEEMDRMIADPSDPRIARQDSLSTEQNPIRGRETLTRVSGQTASGATLDLVYVADKWLLGSGALEAYLATLLEPKPHALAALLLDDLSNVLVPKFLQVRVSDGTTAVLIEDRRPRWDNPALLSRMASF